MSYIKNIWVDQNVERPKTYQVTNNADGSITLTEDFGIVTELGTPVDQAHMNHIEEGIEQCYVDLASVDLNNLSDYGEARLGSYFRWVVNDGKVDEYENLDLIDAEISTDTTYTYAQAGTYTFEVPTNGNYDIAIVGGGGKASVYYVMAAGVSPVGAGGGSGAGFVGTITLNAGIYTVVVGNSGQASVLKDSSNNVIIQASAGGNGSTGVNTATGGAAGVLNVSGATIVGTPTVNRNGYAGGKNTSGYSASGGASVYNGYGAGGSATTGSYNPAGYYNGVANSGKAGFFQVKIVNQGSTVVNYKVSENQPLTIVDARGIKTSFIGVNNDQIGSLTDGTYNKFIDDTGTDFWANTIYYQINEPTNPDTNDIWCKTVDKLEVYKWSGSEWENYNKVWLGSITILNGSVSKYENTYLYNNGFNRTKYIDKYVNGTSWYRIYPDGWCEQGASNITPTSDSYTVSLLVPFKDINYTVVATSTGATSNTFRFIQVGTKAVDGFTYGTASSGTAATAANNVDWYACGYIR